MIFHNPLPTRDLEWLTSLSEVSEAALDERNSTDMHFLHMSNWEMATLHILSKYDTPTGVYAYPFTRQICFDLMNKRLPFQAQATYAHILRIRNPEGIFMSGDKEHVGYSSAVAMTRIMANRAVGYLLSMEGMKQKLVVDLLYYTGVREKPILLEAIAKGEIKPVIGPALSSLLQKIDYIVVPFFENEHGSPHALRMMSIYQEIKRTVIDGGNYGDIINAIAILTECYAKFAIAISIRQEREPLQGIYEHIVYARDLASQNVPYRDNTLSNRLDFILAHADANLQWENLVLLRDTALQEFLGDSLELLLQHAITYGADTSYTSYGYTIYQHIWNITRVLADGNPRLWNILLRASGINGLIDNARTGLIHSNERFQAVFLTPSAYEVIATFNNPSAGFSVCHREKRTAFQNFFNPDFVRGLLNYAESVRPAKSQLFEMVREYIVNNVANFHHIESSVRSEAISKLTKLVESHLGISR